MNRPPRTRRGLLALLAVMPLAAAADDTSLHGFLDCRLVAASDARGWTDGGLGKTRYGSGDDGATCAQAVLAARWQITPSIAASATVQAVDTGPDPVSVLEATLRYRPVSTTPGRMSFKVGEFFPPISLENTSIGWTSPWTLTPSAIDSWVGEELRAFGAEGQWEWRSTSHGTFGASAAAFRSNDPAGELLFARGWALDDLVSGWGSRVREPDVYAIGNRVAVPLRFNPFLENDGRLGWYAGGSWQMAGTGKLSLLRYDNRADPASHSAGDSPVFSWHTRFWSGGAEADWGDFTFLAQAMTGSTDIAPSPSFSASTGFRAAYLLAGYAQGSWRAAMRLDAFASAQSPHKADDPQHEHGSAATWALNWRPKEWLRLTAEFVVVRSDRFQRIDAGGNPFEIDRQLQCAARLFF